MCLCLCSLPAVVSLVACGCDRNDGAGVRAKDVRGAERKKKLQWQTWRKARRRSKGETPTVVALLVVGVVVGPLLVLGLVVAGYRSSPPVSLPPDADAGDAGVRRWRRRVVLGCVSLPLVLVLVQQQADHGHGDEDDVAASRCVGSV